MGRKKSKPSASAPAASMSGLAEALFSRSQLRVLSILFGHPERSFHTAEIIRLARTGSGAVQRELARLENSGILQAELLSNRKLFRANRSSPIFGELRAIILKTVGLREPIRQALLAFKSRINVAFVYGSVARGADKAESDIDIMIVGDMLSYSEIYVALQSAERLLMRKINPNLVTTSEWKSKLAERNPFIVKVSKQPKLYIFGSSDELKGIGQSR